MRYLIIGAGGTGGFMAANMAEAGLDVAVIARGEHLQRIRAQGLGLETPERGEYTVWVKACSMEEYLGTDRGDGGAKVFDGQAPDVIFVCVKGYSLEEAVSFIRQAAAFTVTQRPGRSRRMTECEASLFSLSGRWMLWPKPWELTSARILSREIWQFWMP